MKNDCDFKIRLPNVNPRFLIDMIPEFREIIRTGKIEAMGIGVQSGNNRILKLMNRGYRIEDYKEAVSILKSEYPPLNIRTNIIVGFPSETEEEFEDTLKLIKEIDFAFADVHRYSPRSKTKAAKMKGQLPPEVIEERFSIFNEAFLENLRKNANRILFFN